MMNPLKLALVTLACASALSVTPYFVKKLTAKESSPSNEKATAPLGLAELPVETAPSLLSSAKADAESFAPTAELELKPSPVAAQPAPVETSPEPARVEIVAAETATPSPVAVEAPKAEKTVVASLPAPTIKVNLPAPSAFAAPAAAVAQPQVAVAPIKPEIQFSAEVKEAQEHLAKLGLETGKVDGKLGPKTQAAIKDFQHKNGLPADGQATKDTLVKMSEAVAAMPKVEPKAEVIAAKPDDAQFVIISDSRPAKKRVAGPVPSITKVADVKRLQETLAAAKVYDDKLDGKWGQKTIAAVEEFQKKNKLKVSGKPDEATWKKLNQVVDAKWETRYAKLTTAPKKALAAEKVASADTPKGIVKMANPIVPAAETVAAPEVEKDTELKISAPEGETPEEHAAVAAPQPKISATEPESVTTVEKTEEPTTVASVEPVKTDSGRMQKVDPETLEISKPASQEEAAVEVAKAEVEAAPEVVASGTNEVAAPAPVETVAEVATAEPVEKAEVVVRVNADAGEKVAVALATPAIVSAEVKTPAPDESATIEVSDAAPAVQAEQVVEEAKPAEPVKLVAAPVELPDNKIVAAEPQVIASAGVPAPGAQLRDVNRDAALEKEMEKAQEAESKPEGLVSNPSPLDVTKSSAQMVAPIESLVDKVNRESASPVAKEELEKAKIEALRKKASDKVAEVEATYKELKNRFADQVNKGTLVDTMAKIDNGFTAMKADFKKGNYSPIVDRCDGFKLAIEMLANDAAKLYVESTLEKKSVRSKLSKSDVDEIEGLCGKNKFIEAADQLDKVARKSDSKRG